MAPAVELTEVDDMAKATVKTISEMNKEELEVFLSEEKKDKAKIEFAQYRLDEMSDEDSADDDADEDDDAGAGDDKKKKKMSSKKEAPKELNFEELKEAYAASCKELSDLKKSMVKNLAEVETTKKKTAFLKLVASGKAVPAQEEAFMADDMIKFSELAAEVKLGAIGANGEPIKQDTTAQDQILKLAEEKRAKDSSLSHGDAISKVLAENKELTKQYNKEVEASV